MGVGDGQGGLVCCDSWGHRESDTTEQLNWTEGKEQCGGIIKWYKETSMVDEYIILIKVMISEVYTYVKTFKIVYFQYLLFMPIMP